MAFNLVEALAGVSDLDTGKDGREQIEYIDIDLIDDDPKNFYELSNLDKLAANIELLGLQQPIRVRADPDAPGRVIIVSGHRRRAALRILIDAGRDDLREIPCIKERAVGSPELEELRLIYANSDTRDLTSAEISKQAVRVEELLYQLKEQGMEFPGRMRDHVAEACKVSKTKLARLKVIRDKLHEKWMPYYEKGTLSENVAYRLARASEADQRLLYDVYEADKYKGANGFRNLYEYDVDYALRRLEEMKAPTCRYSCPDCDHMGVMRRHNVKYDSYDARRCKPGKCCSDCDNLASCGDFCHRVSYKVNQLKAERKEAKKQAKEEQAKKDAPDIEMLSMLWERFGLARAQADISMLDFYEAASIWGGRLDEDEAAKRECREKKIKVSDGTPYNYQLDLYGVKRILKIADALHTSLDFLFGRTDSPRGAAQTAPTAGETPVFTDGSVTPPESGLYYCKFNVEGTTISQVCAWNSVRKQWHFKNDRATTIDFPCICWHRLPEDLKEGE